jgi:uncharacterized integral membrane protein
MRVRSVALIVAGVLSAIFLSLNWSVFAQPASFYFVVGTISMPIGVVMLGLIALVTLGYAIFLGIWQGRLLMDYRRQSKELQTQRILADDAEASRFTALTVLIKEEMAQRDARLEAAFTALRNELRDTEHSIAATLGEMDDRQRRLDGETVRPAG